jgi:hypothetical protein
MRENREPQKMGWNKGQPCPLAGNKIAKSLENQPKSFLARTAF